MPLIFSAALFWHLDAAAQNVPAANFSKVLFSRQANLKSHREFAFALKQSGQVIAHFQISSDTDWENVKYPAVLLEAMIDERLASHLVTYLGRQEKVAPFYSVHLGYLAAGRHDLGLQRADSSKTPVQIRQVRVDAYETGNPFYAVLAQAPIIFGRAHRDFAAVTSHGNWLNHDMRVSDVPLLLAYEQQYLNAGQELKYTAFFSNENGGTPPPGLLHLWGRYTDIEWAYRVELDTNGKRRRSSFQAKDHAERSYLGSFENEQPTLQVATLNNMFSDSLTTKLRFALPPIFKIPANGMRESVMLEAPWSWQVSAKEARREQRLNPHPTDSTRIADLRRYLYIQFIAEPESLGAKAGGYFVAKFKNQTNEYASNLGSPALIIRSDKKMVRQTAIPLPAGTTPNDLERLDFVADSQGGRIVLTHLLRFFALDDHDLPRDWPHKWQGKKIVAPKSRIIFYDDDLR